MKKKTEKFLPGSESEEQFEKVLSLLAEWIKGGIVNIKVDTDGDVDFDLPSEMGELLEAQIPPDLNREDVVSIIESEIPALIGAGLSENAKAWLERRLPDKLEEILDAMTARSGKAVEKLVDAKVTERVLLRKATSVYVVDGLRWKRGTYHLHAGKDRKIDVPHVSLEIRFSRPHSGQVLTLYRSDSTLTGSRKDDISVALELHKEDILQLAKDLEKIAEEQG